MYNFISKFNWTLISALIVPNLGGCLSAIFMINEIMSPEGEAWYKQLIKPVWTPPNWLFGLVWIFLYTGMGYASYLIIVKCKGKDATPMCLYAIQLLFNWLWIPIFFGLRRIGLALIHMIILDVLAIACAARFNTVNKTASYWMMPYLGWLIFATCFNYTIWTLNNNYAEAAQLIV